MEGGPPNLSVHQLLYVREAAYGPTWTEAAHRLGVTQSALSQGVAEVERRLGVTLFHREGRRRDKARTPALDALLPVAEAVLAAVDDLDRRMDELATGTRGSLRVGMIDTAALGALAAPLARYRAVHPALAMTLIVEPSAPLTAKVATGSLDLAVVVSPNAVLDEAPERFEAIELRREPIHVYAPSAGEARRRPSRWGPWVTYPAGSQSRSLIERALAAKGVPMVVVAESSNPDVLRQMVRLGVGWCALPVDVAEPRDGVAPRARADKRSDALVRVPGPALTERTLTLIRRRHALPNGAADALVDALVAARA